MVSIKHKKVLTIPDNPDAVAAGMVVSSDWNNTLDFKAEAPAILLGRKTAGVGDIEELSASDTRTLLGLVPGLGAGNIVQLDVSGKLDTSVLPALAITETFVVASQTAMLALSAQMGDFAIRSDVNKTFVLSTNSPSTLADWKEILVPGAPVTSVDSQTGNPTIGGITAAATSKATLVDADKLPISDSAAENVTKHLTWANLKAGIWSAWGALIAAGTAKTTPVDADVFAIGDSAASNTTKKTTLANIKAVLKTYFDTLYQPVGTSSGSKSLLASTTVAASVSTVDFTVAAAFDGTYKEIELEFWDVIGNAAGGVYMYQRRVSDSIWAATMNNFYEYISTSGTSISINSTGYVGEYSSDNVEKYGRGKIRLSFAGGTQPRVGESYWRGGSSSANVLLKSCFRPTVPVNGLRIFIQSTNIIGGEFRLWGIK